MKRFGFSKIMTVAMLAGAPVLWSACSDAWDDHYGVQAGGMADQPSLLENIASDPRLANFYKVIKATGAEEMLNSPQQLTVWAPLNLTDAQADSIIAVYEADAAAGLKIKDNKAYTQFLNNHIALYSRSVSSLTDDTVTMLNQKFMHLKGTGSTSGSLNDNPFNEMTLSNNGILYKTEKIQTFFPNIREYIDQSQLMDSLSRFIKSFDEYELDENSSVAGGVVDGQTVYLDSVTYLRNNLLSYYGNIVREDSVYNLIVPTNSVWESLYNKYKTYYTYAGNVNNADSLSLDQVRRRIIMGRFFNMGSFIKYNRHPEDSICNTMYVERQKHNPRLNVYYKPETSILAGLQKVECSNGYIYVDNKGVIDPHTTFFSRMDYEANMYNLFDVPTDDKNEATMRVSSRTLEVLSSSAEGEEGVEAGAAEKKVYNYLEVVSKVPSAQTSIEYTLPSTLSGCYYNIYVVTVPNMTNNLPLWFQVGYAVPKETGIFPGKVESDGRIKVNYTYFDNPSPVTADSDVENADVILKQSNNNRCFVASAEKIDTILVKSAMQFPYSGYGLNDGVVKLSIGSFGPSSATYRENIYTRTLSLCEIILVPFETEEEAEAAARNLDAFNDELLEANKKN